MRIFIVIDKGYDPVTMTSSRFIGAFSTYEKAMSKVRDYLSDDKIVTRSEKDIFDSNKMIIIYDNPYSNGGNWIEIIETNVIE